MGETLLFSNLSEDDQARFAAESRALTDRIYPKLDVSTEIWATHRLSLGDTAILHRGSMCEAFAICHVGAGTEAGSESCFVKFGAATPGADSEKIFVELMRSCEGFAASRKAEKLTTNMNAGRTEAYRLTLEYGFKMTFATITMTRPDISSYDRPVAYVMDRWS